MPKKPTAAVTVIIENGKLFGEFLNKVSMNSQIPDALITIDNEGHVESNSIDSTLTMFSMCTCYVGETTNIKSTISVGIPQINVLAKHLDSEDQHKLTIGNDRIAITRKGKKGALKFRTTPKDDIGTLLSEDVTEVSLELDDKIQFQLNGEKLEELLYFMSLTTCSCVIFEIDKGRLYAMSPDVDIIQFKLFMCKTDEDELRVAAYAKPLSCILSILKGAPVSFYLGEDSPVILEQEGNYWGVAKIDE